MAEYSILVVEDEHTLRRLLEYRLSKQYTVRTAANGEEALQRVGERIPDLIISDIMMPKMDGFALQAELQKEKTTRAIPFIFLTAKADEQSRLRGMRTGVDDYITKPFDIEQLLSRIERLLERTKIYQTQVNARIGKDFSQKLMPKKLPDVPGYRMFFYNSPREHGGGDLFDWAEASPGTYLFTIGDVMGKGLQAKFYAFSFLAYVRSTLHGMLQGERSPAKLMQRVNHLLMQDEVMEETFASLLLFQWEPQLHRITYANAGHCRPILLTPDRVDVVAYSDIILGLDPNAAFADQALVLPPGSALITYTDGLMEQRLQTGEMVGEKGIMEIAREVAGAPDPVASMLQIILDRSETDEFGDDILVYWLQRER
jgi:sigma-B regulation protein RsbU (phosphoserine phosphatase)